VNDADLQTRLEAWLTDRRGADVKLALEDRPGSGFSADNVIFTATVGDRTTRHVLRRDTEDGSPYPHQVPGLGNGVVMQASVMRALGDIVPVAAGIEVEPDPGVLGAPFLVMDFVSGVVPIEHPPCTVEGFYAVGTAALRNAMVTGGIHAMVQLHATPWRDSALSALDDPAEPAGGLRQLRLWEDNLLASLAGRCDDVFERATSFLHANIPPQPDPEDVVLIWGDARLGNVIWDPTTGAPLCLTDFEGAAVGERELDLGWWLMADRWMHEGSGVGRLDGEPTRSEQIALYERASGRQMPDLHWYELFAAFRFATAVVGIMNRYERNGVMPDGHSFWRDNPATSLLKAILDDQTTSHI
jgi:aminoglycoside phosphotransferase (APT) family kinase protein